MRANADNKMTSAERRATFGLAGVYGARMLGLFLILPVFALFAEGLAGATPFLTGLAVGIYGLTQAALQIPFGLLSDRIGRKPVIFAGLLLFALGSAIAALADEIWLNPKGMVWIDGFAAYRQFYAAQERYDTTSPQLHAQVDALVAALAARGSTSVLSVLNSRIPALTRLAARLDGFSARPRPDYIRDSWRQVDNRG